MIGKWRVASDEWRARRTPEEVASGEQSLQERRAKARPLQRLALSVAASSRPEIQKRRAKARPLQSPQGGACRRRDLSRREDGRRVRRASGGPGGRECAENPGPHGRPCACCIQYSRKPGCGRNCVRNARVARRGRGTVRGRECGGDNKSKRRVRDREWSCGVPKYSGNPWPQGQRQEALPRLGRRH